MTLDLSNFRLQVPLAPFTWWKIGGSADYLIEPKSIDEAAAAWRKATKSGGPVTWLGGGSNVLIGDRGIRGFVLLSRSLNRVEEVIETDGRLQIVTQSGAFKSELVKIFLKHKLAPALFLCGIPGEVGGGVVMNAGVGEEIRPREFCEIVDWIEIIDPAQDFAVKRIGARDLKWSYRHSEGWQPGWIVRVAVSWPLKVEEDLMNRVRLATRNRVQRQPLELPSCGSVFRNPPGHKAGALIEKAGLKGYQVGAAQVSLKHANFIVNLGRATASDVRAVMDHVQTTVQTQFGVKLETEVRFLGEF